MLGCSCVSNIEPVLKKAGSKYKMRCNLKWYICCKASTTKIYLLTTTGVLPTHYGEGVLVGRTIHHLLHSACQSFFSFSLREKSLCSPLSLRQERAEEVAVRNNLVVALLLHRIVRRKLKVRLLQLIDAGEHLLHLPEVSEW